MFINGLNKIAAFASGIAAAESKAVGGIKNMFKAAPKGVTVAGKTNAYSRAAEMPKWQGSRTIKRLDANAAPKTPKAPKAPAAAQKATEKAPQGAVAKAHDWIKKNPLQATAAGAASGYIADKALSDDRR